MIRGPGVVRGKSVGNSDERVKRRRGYDWQLKVLAAPLHGNWRVLLDAGPLL